MKRAHRAALGWYPSKDSFSYFFSGSDDEFRLRHPFLYPLVVALGLTALMLPCVAFGLLARYVAPQAEGLLAGYIGGFLVGISLFNCVAIILRQYLGHAVTLIAGVAGLLLMALGLLL